MSYITSSQMIIFYPTFENNDTSFQIPCC